MGGKIEHPVCAKFCLKLDKSTTKTLETLCGAFLKLGSGFWMAFTFQGRLSVS
jgi:hypothetical protein